MITGEVAFRLSSADSSVAVSPGAGMVFPKFQLVQSAASWVMVRGMALIWPYPDRNICACAAQCRCRKCSAANQMRCASAVSLLQCLLVQDFWMARACLELRKSADSGAACQTGLYICISILLTLSLTCIHVSLASKVETEN